MDSEQLSGLIQAHLDGRLTDEEFEALQQHLGENPEARAEYVALAQLDAGLRDDGLDAAVPEVVANPSAAASKAPPRWLAVAALVALLVVSGALLLKKEKGSEEGGDSLMAATRGVAVITAEAGAVWGKTVGQIPSEGVALEPGVLILEEGLAQIDFFGGASISLSGPAEIELIDRDAAVLHRGKLKADVPPAARGFEVRVGEVLLEDLGTSFGLSVGEDEKADLIVFDGEVRATGTDGKPLLLNGGEAVRLENGAATRESAEGLGAFPDIADVIAGSGSREAVRYAVWKEASQDRRRDPRLIAYYDFEGLTAATRRIRNQALHGQGSELDGGIVGASVAKGRWGRKTALDFRSEGDRVRFNIPGEYEALSLYAWVRIDALDRVLNSLFLTDYFDENEIHWQISREGVLHFAVSPMGVVDLPKHNRRFFSESFWDPSQSGKWFLLATTVEGGGGKVTHYVNGKPVGFSGGTNMEKPIPVMRIGEADLGNWSEPIWPDRSIRTLNGRIDEFALYKAALTEEEIRNIYEEGKP